MKLQLALDLLDIKKINLIINETIEFIDVIEIGTPLIMKYGITIKLNNNILYILIKIFNFKFKNYFNKSTIENKKLFELLLAIYLLERYMFFEFQIHLNNIDELISQKEKTFNKNNADLILSLITKLIK